MGALCTPGTMVLTRPRCVPQPASAAFQRPVPNLGPALHSFQPDLQDDGASTWVPQLSAHTGNGIERLPRSVSRERLPSAEAPSDGVGPVLPCGAGRRGLASGDVFVRASIRRNSAGVPVRYLQLVHNVWDPVSRTSKAKVLHSFGREDELDRAAIERLIASLRRLLGPAGALSPPDPSDGAPEGLAFVAAKALGATWALDGIWHSL